jgi:hypothetical protein
LLAFLYLQQKQQSFQIDLLSLRLMSHVMEHALLRNGSEPPITTTHREHASISSERLLALKRLFAKDGVSLTDAEALEIGLWLLARTQAILSPIPLDKMGMFATIRNEVEAIRQSTPFVNLYQRRQRKKIHK